eukprot:GDKJ01013905.1.p1 GENE.GDKJ01013905.1~~GDKJ01013905.1.p1  ORF type:complete len:492 (+),score=100.78 GDKJ01013905.1:146-1477(+)
MDIYPPRSTKLVEVLVHLNADIDDDSDVDEDEAVELSQKGEQTVMAKTEIDIFSPVDIIGVGCQDGTIRVLDFKKFKTALLITPDLNMNGQIVPVWDNLPIDARVPSKNPVAADPISSISLCDIFLDSKQKEKDSKPLSAKELKEKSARELEVLNSASEVLTMIDPSVFLKFGTTGGLFGVYQVRTGRLKFCRYHSVDEVKAIIDVSRSWNVLLENALSIYSDFKPLEYTRNLKLISNDPKAKAAAKPKAKKSSKSSDTLKPEGAYQCLVVGFDGSLEIVNYEYPNRVTLRLCEGVGALTREEDISSKDQSILSDRKSRGSSMPRHPFSSDARTDILFGEKQMSGVIQAVSSGGSEAPACAWSCAFDSSTNSIYIGGGDGVIRCWDIEVCGLRRAEQIMISYEDTYSKIREVDCDPGIYAAIEKAKKMKDKKTKPKGNVKAKA